jgi:hypothetical protein
MTVRRTPDDLIKAFLDEGEVDLPDQAFDAVRRDIQQTRQRVVIGPWREPHMSNLARVAIAAAAVVAVAVAGVNIGLFQGGIGAVPTPTPTPRSLEAIPADATLGPGRYVLDGPFPRRLSITVPGRWLNSDLQSGVAAIHKEMPEASELILSFWIVSNTYGDACDPTTLFDPAIGGGVDDLVTALSNMESVIATPPRPVSINGLAGQYLDLTRDGDCPDSGDYRLWTNASVPGRFDVGQGTPATHDELWVMDVDGTRVVVDLIQANASADDVAEARAIVESMRLEP